MNRKKFLLATIIVLLFAFILNSQVFLLVIDGEEERVLKPILREGELKYNYIHSVEQIPVEEYFTTTTTGFELIKTVYSSYGAGLPLSRGDFSREEGNFVLSNQQEEFSQLTYRVSSFPDQYLKINGVKYYLDELSPLGKRVTIEVKSLARFIFDYGFE